MFLTLAWPTHAFMTQPATPIRLERHPKLVLSLLAACKRELYGYTYQTKNQDEDRANTTNSSGK